MTLAVAWLAAAFVPFPASHTVVAQRAHGEREWLSFSRLSTIAAVRYHAILMPRALQYTEVAPTESIPSWATLPDMPSAAAADATGFSDYYEMADGYGWPLPALGYRFHGRGHGAGTSGDIEGGITLPPRAIGAWYSPRALPLRPIWSGLFFDWLLATALIVFAGDAYPALVRRARARRLRCVACGYSLRGLAHAGLPAPTCPECGHAGGAPTSR